MLKEPPFVHVTVGVTMSSRLSVAVRVDDPVSPESTVSIAGLKVIIGGSVSPATEIVSVAVPSFPAASEAVAVHLAMVSALTTGAVYMLFAKEPIVHVTVGVIVPSTSSVAVRVTETIAPEATSRVSGLKVIIGGSVSGASGAVMETESVAVPSFPAASVAVTVHVASVSALTTGAV